MSAVWEAFAALIDPIVAVLPREKNRPDAEPTPEDEPQA